MSGNNKYNNTVYETLNLRNPSFLGSCMFKQNTVFIEAQIYIYKYSLSKYIVKGGMQSPLSNIGFLLNVIVKWLPIILKRN